MQALLKARICGKCGGNTNKMAKICGNCYSWKVWRIFADL